MAGPKEDFTSTDAATAALMAITALVGELIRKNVLSTDEGNAVFAMAASSCRGNGSPDAARLIEIMTPTSKGVDVVARARSLGIEITQATE